MRSAGRIERLFAAILSTVAISCSGNDAVTSFPPASSQDFLRVAIDPVPDTMVLGSTIQFIARVSNEDGRVETGKVNWTTTNTDVVVADTDGQVTAVGAGSAQVVASHYGLADTVHVEVRRTGSQLTDTNAEASTLATVSSVSDVARIDVYVPKSTLAVGDTARATAKAYDAAGNQVSVPIAWSSLNSAVVKVGSLGKATAVTKGTASVQAQAILNGVLGVKGTFGLTVQTTSSAPVATVNLSLASSTLAVGQTTQATAVLKDANGAVLSGRSITYSSSNTAVAKVSTSGLVTALATGTATISAVSEGKTGSASLTVQSTTTPIASVTVTLASASLLVGQTTQATPIMKDASGNPVSGAAVTWKMSSGGTYASVSSSGVVTAIGAGQATVTATSGSVSGSATLTVSSSGGGASSSRIARRPTLPQSFVDVSWRAKTGATIQVPAGGNLQQALNNALPGDEIVLAAGATYIGNFTLPVKSGSGWILVRTAGTVPPLGTRLTPRTAGGVARIFTNNTLPALRTGGATRGWRFVGIEFGVTSAITSMPAIVSLGDGSYVQNTLAKAPRDLIFDRVWVHGHPTLNLRRCIALNSAATAVISSTISECHDRGYDSQAIWGWNGPGPFLIENNYLEGSGENVGFGGATPAIPNLVPSDVIIRRNHIAKPDSWKTAGWLVKNLIELKNGRRVLIEENLIEGNWLSGQQGYAIMLTPRSENGTCKSWCVIEDLTFRWNHVRRTGSGLNLTARADADLALAGTRFLFEQNLWDEIGTGMYTGSGRIWFLWGSGLADVTFSHNTALGKEAPVLYCDQEARVEIEDNVLSSAAGYGLWSCVGKPTGVQAVSYHVQNWTYLRNVTINVPGGPQPTGNFYTSFSATQFLNPSAGDWTLSSASPFKGKGEQGTDPGVAFSALKQKLQGVVVP